MKAKNSLHRASPVVLLLICALALCQSAIGAELALSWSDRDGKNLASMTLDLNDLDKMAQLEISTSTPWTGGTQLFSGPTLSDLSLLAGLHVQAANLRALNDYSVEVPKQDWIDYDIVVTTRINGSPLRIYEKGPFWLIYPVDAIPAPLPNRYASRMIWQLTSIDFYVE